ncbi:MAG: hypothetical protein LBF40_07130 [Deltaproteobacteria bacterium]|jgi:hypothetical protein|nr:hypothetical protein [Deltaproteobacteria bacterium]
MPSELWGGGSDTSAKTALFMKNIAKAQKIIMGFFARIRHLSHAQTTEKLTAILSPWPLVMDNMPINQRILGDDAIGGRTN